MSKTARSVVALVAAFGVLAALAWFDTVVLVEAQRRTAATFDPGQESLLISLGAFAIAGALLLLWRLGVGSGSVAVGAIYLVVGAFFGLLPWLLWTFAAGSNDVPPRLPDPLATAVAEIYARTVGLLDAVVIIGAGMAIIGGTVIVGAIRGRDGRT